MVKINQFARVCWSCLGWGIVYGLRHGDKRTCPICFGSGKISPEIKPPSKEPRLRLD